MQQLLLKITPIILSSRQQVLVVSVPPRLDKRNFPRACKRELLVNVQRLRIFAVKKRNSAANKGIFLEHTVLSIYANTLAR